MSNIKITYSHQIQEDRNELDKILTVVKDWGVSFDYNIQTDEFALDIFGYISSKLGLQGLKIEDTLSIS